MSDQTLFSAAAMNETATAISTGASTIAGELANLKTKVDPLTGHFQGQNAEKYLLLVEDWRISADKLNQSLTELSKLLSHAANTYQQADDVVRQSMKG